MLNSMDYAKNCQVKPVRLRMKASLGPAGKTSLYYVYNDLTNLKIPQNNTYINHNSPASPECPYHAQTTLIAMSPI